MKIEVSLEELKLIRHGLKALDKTAYIVDKRGYENLKARIVDMIIDEDEGLHLQHTARS